MTDKQRRLANSLVSTGSDLAGNLSSVGIGMLLAGPPGALAGAALAPIVKSLVATAAEFAQRRLSPRESVRVGALIAFTSERIRANLDEGKIIRDDGFFSSSPSGGRSVGDQLAEE